MKQLIGDKVDPFPFQDLDMKRLVGDGVDLSPI